MTKKIIMMILLAAITSMSIIAPLEKASAATYDENGNYIGGEIDGFRFKDGYWERTAYVKKDETFGYTYTYLFSVSAKGGVGDLVGSVAYDKNGNCVYKVLDGKNGEKDNVILDKRYFKGLGIYKCTTTDVNGGYYEDGTETQKPTYDVTAGFKSRTPLSCRIEDRTGSIPVTWSSSNPKVAIVDSNGYIVGKKTGTATITAMVSASGQKCYATIKVKKNQFTRTSKSSGIEYKDIVSYDKRGNLIAKVKMRNTTKKKKKYTQCYHYLTVRYKGKSLNYSTPKKTGDKEFTIKPKKTKTFTLKVTKSKRKKKKMTNLDLNEAYNIRSELKINIFSMVIDGDLRD